MEEVKKFNPRNTIKKAGGRPPKLTDPDEFDYKVREYFRTIPEGKTPTIEGLAVHLECSRDILMRYNEKLPDEIEKDRIKAAKFRNSLKYAYANCRAALVDSGLNARNPAMQIFLLKNNYGYKDKQEIETNLNVNVADEMKAARERALRATQSVDTIDVTPERPQIEQ